MDAAIGLWAIASKLPGQTAVVEPDGARYPSRPGDDLPDGKVYDSMDELLADLDSDR